MWFSEIIRLFIGVVITSGIAVWVFKTFGEKWLNNKFAKNLEDHKAKINSLFSRVSKIHEREFEVLPEAWRKLQDALGHVSAISSPLQSHPDLNLMNEQQLKGFVSRSRLRNDQQEEILKVENKYEYYVKAIFWHNLEATEKVVSDFHDYIIYNKIFFTRDLYDAFKLIDDALSKTLKEQEIGTVAGDREMRLKFFTITREEIEPLVKKLESLVQRRLHYAEA